MPTCADRGCGVVSAEDPHCRNHGFLDRNGTETSDINDTSIAAGHEPGRDAAFVVEFESQVKSDCDELDMRRILTD
jgi:hypothetical protein